MGRFLQADTIVPGAGNPQALNRYSYTLNNPLKYADSSGHCAVIGLDTAACVVLGISAALVVTVAIVLVPPEVRHAGASAFANMVTGVVEGIRPPAHVSTLRGLTDSEQNKIDKIGRIDRLIAQRPDLQADVEAVLNGWPQSGNDSDHVQEARDWATGLSGSINTLE